MAFLFYDSSRRGSEWSDSTAGRALRQEGRFNQTRAKKDGTPPSWHAWRKTGGERASVCRVGTEAAHVAEVATQVGRSVRQLRVLLTDFTDGESSKSILAS